MATPTSELGPRVPRKAKTILNQLVGSRSMTPEGMEWLICATDPFHDDRVRCPGYPDLSTVNSVAQVYTTTTSISAPAGQTAAWDLHVPFIPVTTLDSGVGPSRTPIQAYTFNGSGVLTGLAPQVQLYSGFNAISTSVTGTDWLTTSGAGIINNATLAIPSKFTSGHFRLVSAGVEVVNTTAELYKGGSLTCYRAPSAIDDSMILRSTTLATVPPTTLIIPEPVLSVSLPPTTQAEAATFTDSRTWAAEEGAYIVVTQTDIDNPYKVLAQKDTLIKKTYDSSSTIANITNNTGYTAWSTTQSPLQTAIQGNSNSSALDFEECGCILAGLNPNSTIQLTVKYYFERIPATTEPDLLAMAQCPPAFDGVALEIYSRCLSTMPVGVPVAENPLGEWFSSVLDTVSHIAPKIGGFLQNIGTAMGGRSKMVMPTQNNATPKRRMNQAQRKQMAKNPKAPSSAPTQGGKRKRNRKKKQWVANPSYSGKN
jgi:hypothetical protein